MPYRNLETLEHFATNASYAASGAAVFLGLTANEWGIIGVLVGIALGISTFLFNVWFKMKYGKITMKYSKKD